MWKKIINKLMKNGSKFKSEKIYLKSLKIFHRKSYKNPDELLKLAVMNVSPAADIRKRLRNRRRKRYDEAPCILTPKARISYAVTSIVNSLTTIKKKDCVSDLVNEILDSAKAASLLVTKKELTQESAFKKKKFARFRWF
uniref:Ribosomal protein S7 n=1 Tax=Toxarium undulatum TaxID=210620 RepID=A0A2U9GI58_9STRA|nr:ribosomal protein S7 [Toxarium undulatum]AWQ64148.1 ribosomal protein S7 [Toxarium undulatum]